MATANRCRWEVTTVGHELWCIKLGQLQLMPSPAQQVGERRGGTATAGALSPTQQFSDDRTGARRWRKADRACLPTPAAMLCARGQPPPPPANAGAGEGRERASQRRPVISTGTPRDEGRPAVRSVSPAMSLAGATARRSAGASATLAMSRASGSARCFASATMRGWRRRQRRRRLQALQPPAGQPLSRGGTALTPRRRRGWRPTPAAHKTSRGRRGDGGVDASRMAVPASGNDSHRLIKSCGKVVLTESGRCRQRQQQRKPLEGVQASAMLGQPAGTARRGRPSCHYQRACGRGRKQGGAQRRWGDRHSHAGRRGRGMPRLTLVRRRGRDCRRRQRRLPSSRRDGGGNGGGSPTAAWRPLRGQCEVISAEDGHSDSRHSSSSRSTQHAADAMAASAPCCERSGSDACATRVLVLTMAQLGRCGGPRALLSTSGD